MRATLFTLEQTIRQRRSADPSTSYVAKLTARGRGKIAQKVGEEAVEAVIAAMAGNRDELVGESADLLFHLLLHCASSYPRCYSSCCSCMFRCFCDSHRRISQNSRRHMIF